MSPEEPAGDAFKPGGRLVTALCALYGVGAALAVVEAGVVLWQVFLVTPWADATARNVWGEERWAALEAEYFLSFDVAAAVGVSQLAVGLPTAVALFMATYRAGANAHALARGVEYTPRWAVALYFVPIANLIRPLFALQEFARAGSPQPRRDRESTARAVWSEFPAPPSLAVWWWGSLLAAGVTVFGGMLFEGAARDDDPTGMIGALWLSVAGAGIAAGSAVAAVVAFRTLFRLQADRFAQRPDRFGAGRASRFAACGDPLPDGAAACPMCGAEIADPTAFGPDPADGTTPS